LKATRRKEMITYQLIMSIKPHRTCCKTHKGCINAHKKSTTLEIIYSDQKTTLQEVNTIMISNLNNEHAWSYEIAPILEALFRYIDSLSLPERPYVTGRPPVSKDRY
jgi:hypothetical protein